MAEECCASTVPTMILACAGGSYAGQLTNQAAVELTREGFGRLFCLAAIGARLSGFVDSAKKVPQMVVLDGCEVACAKKVLEQAGVPVRGHLVLTQLGIDKTKPGEEDLARVKAAVQSLPGTFASGPYCPYPPPETIKLAQVGPPDVICCEVADIQGQPMTCACQKT